MTLFHLTTRQGVWGMHESAPLWVSGYFTGCKPTTVILGPWITPRSKAEAYVLPETRFLLRDFKRSGPPHESGTMVAFNVKGPLDESSPLRRQSRWECRMKEALTLVFSLDLNAIFSIIKGVYNRQ